MKKIIKKIKLPLIFATIFLLANSVFAQTNEWTLQVDWPDSPIGTPLDSTSGIAELVKYFYEWGIAIGIIIFFGVLVYAGFLYITSTGNPDKLNIARQRIVSGFAGVLLLLGSYLILNTINPELTNIKKITPPDEAVGLNEFQSSLNNKQNLCEFGVVTTRKKEGDDNETNFMIPGMSIKGDPFFPTESIACKPDKEEKEILEVRKNDTEGYYELVKKYSGNSVDPAQTVQYLEENEEGEKEEIDGYEDDLKDLYAQRYEESGSITIPDGDDIHSFLRKAKEKRSYNIFPDCEEIINKENFNRSRCLEYNNNNNRELKEWTRIGYPSLTDTFEEIMNNSSEDGTLAGVSLTDCPDDYIKATSGGGCSLAFYDGEEDAVWPFGWGNTPSCRDQISRPPATMDHFDGIVDREANCMELIRHEPPLDIDLPKHTLTIKNQVERDSTLEVVVNGSKINEAEESTEKDVEIEKYSRVEIEGNVPGYQGSGGDFSVKCLKLSGLDSCTKTNYADSISCNFTITNNNTVILKAAQLNDCTNN